MENSEMTRGFMAFFRDDNCSFFKKKGSIFFKPTLPIYKLLNHPAKCSQNGLVLSEN